MCAFCSTCTLSIFHLFDLKYIPYLKHSSKANMCIHSLILVTCTVWIWYFACISDVGLALVPSVLQQQASGPCDVTVSFSCILNKIRL